MASEQTIGTYVKIHGVSYRIIGMRNTSDLGSKFFGKISFTLVDASNGPNYGAKFRAYGKRVAWNSRLVPVDPPVVAEIPAGMVAVQSGDHGFMTDGCCVGFDPHSRRPLECRFCGKTTEDHPDACDHAYMPAPPVIPTCDHETGSEGCALDTCKGVPSATLADRNRSDIRPDASPSECGSDSYGRDIANACQARMRNASVTMPVYTDSDHWTRKGMRSVSAYAFTVGGHAVTVVTYEVPGNCLSLDAIYVDGFRVVADYDSLRNGRVNALAYLITEHISMITVRADADPSLASAVPAGASIVARHLDELRPGDVVRSFYDYRGHATVTGMPVRGQYSHTVATVVDRESITMTGARDAVYAIIIPGPAETVQDATDTPAGTSHSTGTLPRGEVTVWAPTREGDGTSRRWTRTIAGVPFGFTAVLMPTGERRYVVTRYNGYGDDGTVWGRESGMRFGCAWSPVHSITVAAPEVTPDATPAVVQLAACGCPRETLALCAPNDPPTMPSIGHRAACSLHIELKGNAMTATATPAPEVTPDAASDVTPDATPATPAPRARLAATVSVVDLLPALTLAAWGAPKYPSVPVLAGVLLTGEGDALTVASFDWERSVRTVVPAAGDVSGWSLVNAKDLLTLVKGFKVVKAGRGKTLPVGANMVTLADNGRALTVTYGSRVATLPTMPAEDFPALPSMPETVATVDAATFAAGVKRVTPAAGKDDTLPNLTMVHCTPNKAGTALVMTTTDRYRAVFESCPWSQVDDSVSLAPWAHSHVYAPTLAYVASLAGKVGGPVAIGYATCVGLATKDKITITESVGWSFGPHTITTVTPDVAFPPIRALWPDTFTGVITVNAATLVTAVKALDSNAGKGCPVVVKVDGQSLALSIGTADGGTDRDVVPCTDVTLPDGFTLAVNGAYLSDAVRPAGTADVMLRVVAANKPVVVVVPSVPTFECLLMTVRIGGNESNDDHKATPVAATSEEPTVNTDTPATPVVPAVAGRMPDFATPPTPAKIDAVERDADAARVAMLAGDFPAARKLLRKAERIAPAGYTVGKGNMTFDAIRTVIGVAEVAWNERAERDAANVTPAPVATVAPAPVAPVAVLAPVAPVAVPSATPASDAFDPRTVLSGATWGHGNVGTAREPHTVDVLTLPAGRLAREQYTAVAAVVNGIGGVWKKSLRGFAFEPSRAQFTGGYSASGPAKLTAYLANEPAVTSTPVASVPDATPAPAPAASVADIVRQGQKNFAENMTREPIAPAPVAVPVVASVPDATPALSDADASALAAAKVAAVSAIVAPASVPAPVVDASDALTFTLAPFAKSGQSYMASRKVVRKALLTAGIRGHVATADGNRRGFTVAGIDPADRERVAAIVAGAVVLDTVTA